MTSIVLLVALTVGPSLLHGQGLLLAEGVQKDQPLAPALTTDCKLASNWSQWVNHCALEPTAYVGDDLWLRAARDLEAPAEITVDYDRPFSFLTARGTVCVLQPSEKSFKQC